MRSLTQITEGWKVLQLAVMTIGIPKGLCRYMVYTYGPKGFPYTYFKAQVYPIYLHRPFGHGENQVRSAAAAVNERQTLVMNDRPRFRVQGSGCRV